MFAKLSSLFRLVGRTGYARHAAEQSLVAQDKVDIKYRPVHMEPLDNEMEYVPPKVRSY